MILGNGTTEMEWHPHAFQIPTWIEPVVIATILFASTYLTRARDFSIWNDRSLNYIPIANSLGELPCPHSIELDSEKASTRIYCPNCSRKTRRIFGTWTLRTPNSLRFAEHIHSRLLQKFPFCVEMFYWILQLLIYDLATGLTAYYHAGSENLWDTAQHHGIAILELESYILGNQDKTLPGQQRWIELRIQQWFLAGAIAGDWRGIFLTILNRSYSLIHIPSTAGFIAFYYFMSPTFARFATVRRMMTLCNFIAFFIFAAFPCMPPRLLPAEYGFIDTVNGENATSVWQSGNFVNRLAAMPSMHFGYAFCISCVCIYESQPVQGMKTVYRKIVGRRESRKLSFKAQIADEEDNYACDRSLASISTNELNHRSTASRSVFFAVGIWYICWVLLTIVVTANHYFMDALVAMIVVLTSFICNRFLLNFLPLEDVLLWAWRLEKPIPTTGSQRLMLSG